MVGTTAIISNIVLILFPLVLILIGLHNFSNKKKKKDMKNSNIIIGLVVVTLFLSISITILTIKIINYQFLSSIKINSVVYIKINNNKIVKREQIISIINSLNDKKWFSTISGATKSGKDVDIVIKFKNNINKKFVISQHREMIGGIIKFYDVILPPWGTKKGGDVEFYSPTLSKVLKDIGIDLPKGNND